MTRHRHERIDTGIERIHRTTCAYLHGARCDAKCSYRAEVYDRGSGRSVRKTTRDLPSARKWRIHKAAALMTGQERVLRPERLNDALDQWVQDARDGVVRSANGQQYKPQTLVHYARSIEQFIKPKLGRHNVNELRTKQVQDFADQLYRDKHAASTVAGILAPLGVFYGWAIRQEMAHVSPCHGVKLHSLPKQKRVQVADPAEALLRLGILQDTENISDREVGLWATAFFAGLRRGELAALDWPNLNLVTREVRITRSFDYTVLHDSRHETKANSQILSWPDRGAGAYVGPKTERGERTIGLPTTLLPYLEAVPRRQGLVFGLRANRPFDPHGIGKRARDAWEAKDLGMLTLHDARHTYASLMIAAGVDLVEISRRMGHSNIATTVDTYGHLLPNGAVTTADKLDSYLCSHLSEDEAQQERPEAA